MQAACGIRAGSLRDVRFVDAGCGIFAEPLRDPCGMRNLCGMRDSGGIYAEYGIYAGFLRDAESMLESSTGLIRNLCGIYAEFMRDAESLRDAGFLRDIFTGYRMRDSCGILCGMRDLCGISAGCGMRDSHEIYAGFRRNLCGIFADAIFAKCGMRAGCGLDAGFLVQDAECGMRAGCGISAGYGIRAGYFAEYRQDAGWIHNRYGIRNGWDTSGMRDFGRTLVGCGRDAGFP